MKTISKPNVDWSKPKDTLVIIKNYIVETAEEEQNWYASKRCKHALLTRAFRFLALLLFGFGIICPLLNLETVGKVRSIGYLFLVIGGIFLLFDKYFGLSSSFVRFYIAEEDIKKNLADFEIAWEMEMFKAEKAAYAIENVLNTLLIARVLRQSVSNTIQVETSAWASEYQAQIGELQELLKQKTADYKRQLGTVSIKLENYKGYTDIHLILDESVYKKLEGTTSAIFRDLTSGTHQIQIKALKSNKPEGFSQNFEVSADKTSEVTLTLP